MIDLLFQQAAGSQTEPIKQPSGQTPEKAAGSQTAPNAVPNKPPTTPTQQGAEANAEPEQQDKDKASHADQGLPYFFSVYLCLSLKFIYIYT